VADSDLSQEIQSFINTHIRSVGDLEVIFLLANDPKRMWSGEEVSRELRTNANYAQTQLKDLARIGVLECVDGKFACRQDPQLLDLLYRLRDDYTLRRYTVINFIYDQPLEKIRGFADAFRLKKD
jgi:hypothetical protein